MFTRKTKDAAGLADPVNPLGRAAPPTKGKATPKRNIAQAARKTSVVGGSRGAGRSAAARGSGRGGRLTPDQAYARRQALRRGDESALPARDRGPARRFARDYVDSRRNVLGMFVPVAIPVVLLGLFFPHNTGVVLFTNAALYTYVLGSFLDGYLMSRAIRKQVASRFPNESTRGLGFYAALRAMQFRRMRMPGPQVARGARL
jgi:hypothetical protein